MNTKTQKITFKIAVTAGLSALIVIMGLTHIGFIPWFSGAAITIIQIPVILCAMLCGWIPGLISGIIFGVFSLIVAATSPTGGLDAFFVNPLISVLPRAMMGLACGWVFIGFSSIPKFPKPVNYAITGFIGSFLNTVFVMGALWIAKAVDFKLMMTVVVTNGLLEGAASAIICCAVMSLIMIPKRKSKFADEEEIEESADEDETVVMSSEDKTVTEVSESEDK
ncbi:MAG: ECF transporter S component [Treponemataceae bacterium]|nr:ECF transporter S component [Treponemataceae bacterium]